VLLDPPQRLQRRIVLQTLGALACLAASAPPRRLLLALAVPQRLLLLMRALLHSRGEAARRKADPAGPHREALEAFCVSLLSVLLSEAAVRRCVMQRCTSRES
jgi:hypothetical protein